MADLPGVTVEGPPTAVAFQPVEDEYANCRVGIWLMLDGQVLGRQPRSSVSDGESPSPAVLDEWSAILLVGMMPALGESSLVRMSIPRREQKGAR
jgi:hypothetical protein